jgi:hypothetical protein
MNKSAFVVRSDIRNVALCLLLASGLAACGAGEGGSSSSATASAASDSTPSLVSPNVGLIDRTADVTATNAAATTTSSAAPVSAATSSSNVTTVTASNKTTTNSIPPVKSNTPTTGTVTLDWMPPTENTDGSVLSNLAGYTVYYGTSPGSLTQSVKVTNPGLSAYTVSNLPAGTWYFAVTSYSSTGVESSRTGVVSTTI